MISVESLSELSPHHGIKVFQLPPHVLVQFIKFSLRRIHFLCVNLSLENRKDYKQSKKFDVKYFLKKIYVERGSIGE